MRRAARFLFAPSLLAIALVGCRSIPPQDLPSPQIDGWPPRARYHVDAVHPANRWFHRLTKSASSAQPERPSSVQPERPSSAEPESDAPSAEQWSVAEELSALDRIEIAALLDVLREERDTLSDDQRQRLQSDIESAVDQLNSQEESALAELHRKYLEAQ